MLSFACSSLTSINGKLNGAWIPSVKYSLDTDESQRSGSHVHDWRLFLVASTVIPALPARSTVSSAQGKMWAWKLPLISDRDPQVGLFS